MVMQPRTAVLGGLLAVPAVVLATIGLTQIAGPSADRTSLASAGLRLDDIPGFGREGASVLRDDQIAAYQTYLRERSVASCMESGGFYYRPELLFPPDSLKALTFEPGLPSSGTATTGPLTNDSYADGLTGNTRDAYFQALLGEPAAAVDYVESHDGELPSGSEGGNFAQGGCKGEAMAKTGRIWDLRDGLEEELQSWRDTARATEAMAAASDRFEACARGHGVSSARTPADLERQFTGGTIDEVTVAAASKDCTADWITTDRNEQALLEVNFVNQHRDALQGQLDRFGGLYVQSKGDSGFAQAVAEEIALGEVIQ